MSDEADQESAANLGDPRSALAAWANTKDEWVRAIVQVVLQTGRAPTRGDLDQAYLLFRQEKGLDQRELPAVDQLAVVDAPQEATEPLRLLRISKVAGVNAIEPGAIIEPHEGLTVLFGENGTGKTGYARVLKALANSRTADTILGNIDSDTETPQSALIDFDIGGKQDTLTWEGEQGRVPFTRMSIFDSPAVRLHVDDDLEYVYVPAALALFEHVNAGLKDVQTRIEDDIRSLTSSGANLLERFRRESTVYPLVETLGASTDLAELKAHADGAPNGDERLAAQQRAVAALESDMLASQISISHRLHGVLAKAGDIAATLGSFDAMAYDEALTLRGTLRTDLEAFRTHFFAAADLSSEPDDAWETFVASGDAYRRHLDEQGLHDHSRCLYCRQTLAPAAIELVEKYREYLENKIATDIETCETTLTDATTAVLAAQVGDVLSYIAESEGVEPAPVDIATLQSLTAALAGLRSRIDRMEPVKKSVGATAAKLHRTLVNRVTAVGTELEGLREAAGNRGQALAEERAKLTELTAALELTRSWAQIETQVRDAKQADRLMILGRPLPQLCRQVTELSKQSSDVMINQSFDALFAEECRALRAPTLKVQYVGRQGRAHRHRAMRGNFKPSKVLSEGEQKVLAIADFLAEARLTGISATVVFDDPVSSLDHRRIDEVAERVARLAEQTQVIVFTHDIFFATKLLSLFESSRRCRYYQITDDDRKGEVAEASGPRWDTLKQLKSRINVAVGDAKNAQGETRAALVSHGYGLIRSWCEVFTETELLQGVTQRYQPHVRMTTLANIKVDRLLAAITTVTEIFDRACRNIEAHSQPLATLGVRPTLSDLEADWQKLQECKQAHDA